MVDQGTSWRSKAGGHKTKATKWWKSFLHYLLFGILLVNSFMNMKLANKDDKRSFRDFKKSVIRYSKLHVMEVFSRQQKSMRIKNDGRSTEVKANAAVNKLWKQTPNQYKTEVGSRHHYSRKLKGAAACLEHSVMRAVPLNMLPKYQNSKNPQLLCNLCQSRGISQKTSWCCISCGGALCIHPRDWGTNRFPNLISCMDAAHQSQKIDLTNLNQIRN